MRNPTVAGALATAEPADRARLYGTLGITASYDETTQTAVPDAALPRSAKRPVRGTSESSGAGPDRTVWMLISLTHIRTESVD